ncbi:MAG: Rv1355c family protein [Bacteroidia bacterium]
MNIYLFAITTGDKYLMQELLQKLKYCQATEINGNTDIMPEFFRLNNTAQKQSFLQLLSTPGIAVYDYLLGTLMEFIKTNSPSHKFTLDELQKAALDHIAPLTIEEYGVWVYYPWSNKVVHILDKEEFIEVRTSRNQNKITKKERDILQQKKIGVIGLSVGQSVSLTLCMERICGEIRLADFDTLELTNLNRIRTGVHNLGLPKVYAVAREIAEIDPFISIKCFENGIVESNMDDFFIDGGKLDLLIEESDGFDIKILARIRARELKIPVIMETSDRCMVDVERFDLEPERPILHGLAAHLDIETLKSLKTNEQKIPYMLDILGIDTMSNKLKASMMEIEQTITTWPQLASSVTMGGGIAADVSRRILLDQYHDSGRYHVDIEELIGDKNPLEEATTVLKPLVFKDVAVYAHKFNAEILPLQAKLEKDQAIKIVDAAIWAASGGNCQPWKWVLKNDSLLLYHGIEGGPEFLSYGNFSNYIALGASMENAVLCAKQLGFDSKIDLFPDKKQNELVAQVRFFQEQTKDDNMLWLASGISLRHTNRAIVPRPVIEKELLDELVKLTKEMPGAQLNVFTDPNELDEIADMLGELETVRLLEKGGHADFVDEIRWIEEENVEKRDGVDIRTVDITNSEIAGLKVAQNPDVISLVSKWGGGKAFKKMTKKSIDSAGAICILSMNGKSPSHYFNGGRILERIWIAANLKGLAFQPISACLFLYIRLIEGKGENLSREGQERLWELRPQFEKMFKILPGYGDILIFRLTKAEIPEVKSLRRPLEMAFESIK